MSAITYITGKTQYLLGQVSIYPCHLQYIFYGQVSTAVFSGYKNGCPTCCTEEIENLC